jgi:trigger factor
VERSRIEFPSVLLEKELDDWLGEFDRSLKRQGWNLENYLKMKKQTEEGFRKEISPQVEGRLKRGLVLSRFIELEGLDIESDGTVEKALARLAAIARGELEGVK